MRNCTFCVSIACSSHLSHVSKIFQTPVTMRQCWSKLSIIMRITRDFLPSFSKSSVLDIIHVQSYLITSPLNGLFMRAAKEDFFKRSIINHTFMIGVIPNPCAMAQSVIRDQQKCREKCSTLTLYLLQIIYPCLSINGSNIQWHINVRRYITHIHILPIMQNEMRSS